MAEALCLVTPSRAGFLRSRQTREPHTRRDRARRRAFAGRAVAERWPGIARCNRRRASTALPASAAGSGGGWHASPGVSRRSAPASCHGLPPTMSGSKIGTIHPSRLRIVARWASSRSGVQRRRGGALRSKVGVPARKPVLLCSLSRPCDPVDRPFTWIELRAIGEIAVAAVDERHAARPLRTLRRERAPDLCGPTRSRRRRRARRPRPREDRP